MRPRIVTGIASLLVLTTWLLDGPSQAVPAFARRHGFSCSACHAPIPHLTEVGRRFEDGAFKPPDRQLPPDYYTDVGDEDLSLLESIPLAIRADLYFDIRASKEGDSGATDFKTPYRLRVFSGGRLSDGIGYYLSLHLVEGDRTAAVQDAYIRFDDVFGSGLDLQVGQFSLCEPQLRRELRLTFQDYSLYSVRPGLSRADLTLDRGLMLSYGFGFGLDLTAAVVNGGLARDADLSQELAPNRFKTYLVRLSQGIGPIRLGLLGYWGKQEQHQALVGDQKEATEDRRANETFIWGPDLSLTLEVAQINVQYLQRRDLNPSFGPTNERRSLLTNGFLVEAIAKVWGDPGKIYLVALFNYVDSEATDDQGRPIRDEAYTVNLTYMLRTNIELLAEYTFARFADGLELKEHRATLGVVGAW